MNAHGDLALWILNSLLNAAGVLAAAHAWNTRYLKKYARLTWLLPAVVIAACLASFFGAPLIGQAISGLTVSLSVRSLGTNLLAYLVLGLVFLLIRRATLKRNATGAPSGKLGMGNTTGDKDLRETVESFLSAADTANVDRLASVYAPDFACIRVADAGGFVQLTADQMLSFMRRAVSGQANIKHAVPTQSTKVHHIEIFGDSAIVLLTRTKNLGNGFEPLFYTLLWKLESGTWHLQREIVHQKSAPNWA
jgi:hypothetical protein